MQPNGYPTNWAHVDNVIVLTGPGQFGFEGEVGDLNRFAARFRAAACFRGIALEGYSEATTAGYSALCRVLFTWSALESFMHICGLDQRGLAPLLQREGAPATIEEIRALDVDDRFYRFIYERVNAAHRRELDSYFSDDPCNAAYLASAIRHIFAHGWLTPNANQVTPEAATGVCQLASALLIRVMDAEFGRRSGQGLSDLYGHR